MAKPNESQIKELFAPYLEPGEITLHAAYGVKQPNILLIIGLCSLGILPGLIAIALMTQHYYIALTARRLIVLQVNNFSAKKVKASQSFNRNELSSYQVSTKEGSLFNHIEIKRDGEEFKAKFHRAFSKNNRPNARAISRELQAAGGV